jgi:precorrin-6Y C5,15-methyltransferase (decarboxylating)
VIAIEADPAAAETITLNARRHQVSVRVVAGRAPTALHDLPTPDAVFVGGGGPAVVTAVVALRVPRIVVTCAAVDHSLAAWRTLRSAGYTVAGCQLAVSRFAELPGGAVRLAAANPVTLLSACAESTNPVIETGGTRS